MAVTDKISTLVKDQFPDFYKEEGENFLAFVQAYYEYLEQNGKMTDAIQNLQSYQDIATTTEDFISYFINQFLPGVPLNVAADKKLLVKYARQNNQARGTLGAYKLLFRALYNESIEVVYPADQILKVSDGDWNIDRYLVSAYDPNNYAFIGKTIKGAESEAEALVEDVTRRSVKGRDLMQIFVSNVRGTFNHLEPVRLKGDISSTGHAPIVEAGINSVDIITPGGEYAPGDELELLSSLNGDFAKVVVTSVQDLGGTLTFSLVNGGSGYTPSTDPGGSTIEFIGGDGSGPASFQIGSTDIVDTFAISINIDLISSNTIFGENAPTIASADGANRRLDLFANMVLSSPDYGFRETGQISNNLDFRDHSNAVIVIANTSDPSIGVGASLFGVTSGANATVNAIARAYNSTDVVLRINGYKNFSGSEKVNISTAVGTTVGTVSSFSGNTIGYHVAQIGWIANTTVSPLLENQEIVGRTSGAFGVVKKIVDLTANGYTRGVGGADDRDLYTVQVTANNVANLTAQFDTGPMGRFLENEGLRLVGSNTTVGNVVSSTSNSQIENIYTRLSDAFNFEATTFGTIASLSLPIGGSGYSVAPTIRVTEADIASLGIGEVVLTLQSDDLNWNSGNSSFTKLDTTDKVVQSSTGASGDVKGTGTPGQAINTIQYANGTYEMEVRVFQDFLQRKPSNINYANNALVTLQIIDGSYIPGTPDTRPVLDTGTAKIVSIDDRGVLGENALITTGVGANGTITGLRVLDSGFAYRNKEIVIVERTTRPLATSAQIRVNLQGVANAEGYYASTRSHVSSSRGYLQDGEFYQEFSYQIQSPLSLDRYRDIALELVHPAGQAIFGQFRLQANAQVDVTATANNFIRAQSNGTIALNNGSFDITGTSTSFLAEFANSGTIIIEYANEQFYTMPLNIVTNDTTANLNIAWANGNIASANAYYTQGNIS
tara:strand:+ start:4678 stop:7524 length:2847 start_codon:yes stop_codon:yes gene_type:complete